jgi:uncharacterized iron-regulated membrane protein
LNIGLRYPLIETCHVVVEITGAPIPLAKPRRPFLLVGVTIALALYLPAMTFSLIIILLLEKLIFSRIPSVSYWLGLRMSGNS